MMGQFAPTWLRTYITFMFKKDPQPKSSANIKSSERRQLLAEICKEYNIAKEHLSKEDELALVPATIKQASYQSVQSHKGTIYFNTDEKPLWFRIRGYPLYPTLYTLWQAGYLIPIVQTNAFVIGKIKNNANLMLPGSFLTPDTRVKKRCLMGVVDYKSPTVVLAVGVCEVNPEVFQSEDRSGTAVTIVHRIEDELFNLYDGDYEIPEMVSVEPPALSNEEKGEGEGSEEQEVHEKEEGHEEEEVHESLPGKEIETTVGEDDTVDELAETVSEISVEDMDNFFIRAFIQSVKLDTILLPVSASKMMSDHILKNFPRMDPKYCNIKKSSWKKTAKFLKALEKLNYLSLKGKGDDVVVTEISPPKEMVETFVTHKTIEDAKGPSTTLSKKETDSKLSVLNLYKPTNKVRALSNAGYLEIQTLYSQPQLKDIINTYIKDKELADKKKPKFVNLDPALLTATNLSEDSMTREKIVPSFLKSFSPHYCILQPGETYGPGVKVHKGEPKKIQILTQTVLGRKKTTSILDFEHFFIKPLALAEDLRSKCSGSTAIGSAKRDPSIVEVMVQGPHGPTIIEYLKQKGVPTAFIEFEDKSKGKKKRT